MRLGCATRLSACLATKIAHQPRVRTGGPLGRCLENQLLAPASSLKSFACLYSPFASLIILLFPVCFRCLASLPTPRATYSDRLTWNNILKHIKIFQTRIKTYGNVLKLIKCIIVQLSTVFWRVAPPQSSRPAGPGQNPAQRHPPNSPRILEAKTAVRGPERLLATRCPYHSFYGGRVTRRISKRIKKCSNELQRIHTY